MAGHSWGVAAADSLAFSRRLAEVSTVADPMFDFSHLSPDKRIQLAKDLWDSLSDRRPARGVDAPDRAPLCTLGLAFPFFAYYFIRLIINTTQIHEIA